MSERAPAPGAPRVPDLRPRRARTGASSQRRGLLPLALAGLALAGPTACGGEEGGVAASVTHADGSQPTALDREALAFVRSRIAEHWLEAPDGWTTELRHQNLLGQVLPGLPPVRFHQVRSLAFTLEPEPLTEAQRLNGADYRGAVTFARTAERHYRTVETFEGPPGWSPWTDAWERVLAVERRNGQWLLQDSDHFAGLLPDPAEVPGS